MENFLNKNNKIILWIFVAITAIHVLYAAFSIRVAYMDGGPQLLKILNGISEGTINIYRDPGHPRFFISTLMQFPTYLAAKLLLIQTKFSIGAFYSFCWFAVYPILIYLNYKLSKRTKRFDTFVISLLLYSTIFLSYQIFAVVESSIAILIVLLVYNYLVSEINYTKTDMTILLFLVIMLFGSHELVLFCGPILFITSLFVAKEEPNKINKNTKLALGAGSLFASVFVCSYMLMIKGNSGEISRFINELFGSMYMTLNTNFLITIVGLIILALTLIVFNSKKKLTTKYITTFSIIIFYVLYIMLRQTGIYVNPVREGHYRVIDVLSFPIILFLLALKDIKKINIPPSILNNTITITAIIGIAQTIWQINNTYWWNKNIEYMQNELLKCESHLYIPDEHTPPISTFFINNRRNYIWHADYAAISILFAKDYKIKKMLSLYDKPYNIANANERQRLFVKGDTLSMPYVSINIKNKFWDLTEPAKALYKYNNVHKIKTDKYD